MNSGFVNPGIYSCVEVFLEISTHLFLSYVSNLRIRNATAFQRLFTLSKAGAAIVTTISSFK